MVRRCSVQIYYWVLLGSKCSTLPYFCTIKPFYYCTASEPSCLGAYTHSIMGNVVFVTEVTHTTFGCTVNRSIYVGIISYSVKVLAGTGFIYLYCFYHVMLFYKPHRERHLFTRGSLMFIVPVHSVSLQSRSLMRELSCYCDCVTWASKILTK